MPFKIVRNDITKMNTEAIVNTANDHVTVSTGCDKSPSLFSYQEPLQVRYSQYNIVTESDTKGGKP